MSRLSAMEAKSFLHASFSFFGGEFSDFDDIYIHGVRVSGFGGGGEGVIGLVSWFGVSFGNFFFGTFPLGLKGDSFLIPIIDGGGNSVHRHDLAHEGERDASREISDKDVLVSDACEGRVVLKVKNILNEGQGISVVLSLGHTFGGEPGNGIACGVMVFECGLEFGDEVREGPHSYGGPRDGILSEGGCPGEGGALGHVGQGKGNLLVVIVIDFFIDKEVELYGVQPLSGLVVGSIKGFWCSNMEFGGFRGGHW